MCEEARLDQRKREEGRGDRKRSEESCLSVLHQVGVPVFLSDVIRGGSSKAPAAPPVSRLQHINIQSTASRDTHSKQQHLLTLTELLPLCSIKHRHTAFTHTQNFLFFTPSCAEYGTVLILCGHIVVSLQLFTQEAAVKALLQLLGDSFNDPLLVCVCVCTAKWPFVFTALK